MGIIDYWSNLFTPQALQQYFREQPEMATVVEWWGLGPRLEGKTPGEFVAHLDANGVDAVLIPSAKIGSYRTGELVLDIPDEEVAEVVDALAGRVFGLVGVNPRDGMAGVARLQRRVESGLFVGALLHTYGFGIPLNHRRYYPYFAKCAELDVPVVMQVGHSAEFMPSEMGRPIYVDDVALDFPELRIVCSHTGWPWVTELIAMAWKHPSVYIGTAAHHPKYWDPELVRFANSRGRGKVLFATDFPVFDYPESLSSVEALGLRDDAKELLLGGTARKVFKLS